MSAKAASHSVTKGAGFFRRMGAWFYDLFILIAIEMLAVAVALGLASIAMMLGLSSEGFVDASDFLVNHPIIGPIFTSYIFMTLAGFYSYFWCNAGQTVGMRAWKLRIVNETGGNITFTQALVRLGTACLGIGNLLVLFDKNNRAFQDHFAHCQVVKIA